VQDSGNFDGIRKVQFTIFVRDLSENRPKLARFVHDSDVNRHFRTGFSCSYLLESYPKAARKSCVIAYVLRNFARKAPDFHPNFRALCKNKISNAARFPSGFSITLLIFVVFVFCQNSCGFLRVRTCDLRVTGTRPMLCEFSCTLPLRHGDL
jgi:hypothetical protein